MMKLAAALTLALLSGSAYAAEPQVSLHGFLVNTREIRSSEIRVLSQNGQVPFWGTSSVRFPLETLNESDSLCRSLGYGCLVVNYSDDVKKFRLESPFMRNSNPVRPREISLRGVAPDSGRASRSRLAGYDDFKEAARADEESFSDWMKRLSRAIDLATAQEFLGYISRHPRMASRLTAEFSKSIRADQASGFRSDRSILLERAIVVMALLTAEAFAKIADSGSPTYPYVNDRLVPLGSLLDLDALYTRLSRLNAWPRFRHLQASERPGIAPAMTELDAGSGKYVSTGVYLPESGTVALDLNEPFFDVVYALYHELWHVAVFHSKRTTDAANEVRALLEAPESAESDALIRNTLLRLYAEHELLAIDQSSRLYRATGPLARQWGEAPVSAQGWHDSYFGSSSDFNLFIPLDLRRVVETNSAPNPIALFFIVPAFVELPLKRALAEREQSAILDKFLDKSMLLSSLDAFLESRTPEHLARYRDRYLNDIERFDFASLRGELLQKDAEPVAPRPLHLSCTGLSRLLTVLGPQADYGLPFPFDVEGGWETCARGQVRFQNRPIGFKPRSSLPYLRPASPAAAKRGPASEPQISFRAFPVNTRELQRENLRAHPLYPRRGDECKGGCFLFWPISRGPLLLDAIVLREEDPVCKAVGAGCILVNYAESPDKVWLTPEQRNYVTGGPNLYFTREISLRGAECSDWSCRSRGSRLARYESFQEAEKDDLGEFQRKLRELGGALGDDAISRFSTFVAEHPRLAARLTPELKQSIEKDRSSGAPSGRTRALERATVDLALLMLEAFTKTANSSSVFYPYFKDRLVEHGSLMDLGQLHASLSKVGRWPEIRSLSDGERAKLEPIFLERDRQGHFSATGVYLPDSNTILVDLTEPFYDIVYTLYHELWHVAVYHSKRTSEIGKEVQALLRASESEESNQLIRHTLLRFFAEHELLAIDQSSRLYRATGHLARQWGQPAASAQGWHDSYFGSSEEMNLFVSRDVRKLVNPYGKARRIPYVGDFIAYGMYDRQQSLTERSIYEKRSLLHDFPQFLASRTPFHLAQYKRRYLNDIESFDFDSIRREFAQRNQVSVLPETVHLTCAEVERLAQALGDQSGYGVPFPFDVEGGWDRCPKPIPGFLGKAGKFEPHSSLPNLRFSGGAR